MRFLVSVFLRGSTCSFFDSDVFVLYLVVFVSSLPPASLLTCSVDVFSFFSPVLPRVSPPASVPVWLLTSLASFVKGVVRSGWAVSHIPQRSICEWDFKLRVQARAQHDTHEDLHFSLWPHTRRLLRVLKWLGLEEREREPRREGDPGRRRSSHPFPIVALGAG